MQEKGKFIVIDGVDGSGKATQTRKLVERLLSEGYSARDIDFPRYNENVVGALIGDCLRGLHGDFASIDPKVASVLYAADRFESKQKMEEMLNGGAIIIADRYVSANQIHQGGKIADHGEREKFLAWLEQLEYGVFQIPRPDVTVFLNVSLSDSARLLKKASRSKLYAGGKRDIVESDADYLAHSQESASYLTKTQENWIVIQSANSDSVLKSINEIHEEIYKAVKPFLDQ